MDLCFLHGLSAREILVASAFTYLVSDECPSSFRADADRNALRCVSSAYNGDVLQRCRLEYHSVFAAQLGNCALINATGLPFRETRHMFSYAKTQSRMLPHRHEYHTRYIGLYKAYGQFDGTGGVRMAGLHSERTDRLMEYVAAGGVPGQWPCCGSPIHLDNRRALHRDIRRHAQMCTYPRCHHVFLSLSMHCRPLCVEHNTPTLRRLVRRVIRRSTTELLAFTGGGPPPHTHALTLTVTQ